MRFQPLAVLGRRSCAVLLAALLTPILVPAVAETPAGKGQFLVAAREMNDPNFNRTVILLLRYDTDGAMGLIINRPTTMLPEQVIRDVEGLRNYDGPLFVGGPVQLNVVTFLVRDEDTLERGAYVRDDLQYSGNSELLAELTATATDAGRLRVYAGYSGWAPGQLDVELARGGWHVVPGDTAVVFSENPDSVWETLVPRQAPLSASRSSAPAESDRIVADAGRSEAGNAEFPGHEQLAARRAPARTSDERRSQALLHQR